MHAVYGRHQYKLFSEYDKTRRHLDLTKVRIVSFAESSEFYDFDKGGPRIESKIADNEWKDQWCGLRRCLQCTFHWASTDTSYRNILTGADKLNIDWVREYYTFRGEQWLPFGYVNRVGTVDFVGTTYPSHVTHSVVKWLLLTVMGRYAPGDRHAEWHRFYDQVMKLAQANFVEGGSWASDTALENYFAKFTNPEEKKEKSMLLLRMLQVIYNVEFRIVLLFPYHDISSMRADQQQIYYYTVSDSENVSDRFKTDL
jgi:hypothetical protein